MSLLGYYATNAELLAGAKFADGFEDSDKVTQNGGVLTGSPTVDDGLVLDGATQYATYAINGGVFNSDPLSIVIDFVPDFETDDNAVRFLFSSPGGGLQYAVEKRNNSASNTLRIILGDTTIAQVAEATYNPLWKVGERNTLVVSGTSGDTSAWLNGSNILSNDGSAWNAVEPNTFNIGASGSGGSRFKGTIQDMKIYHAKLSEQDAINAYNGTYEVGILEELKNEGVLQLYHDYRRGTLTDLSGNGNDGVGTGIEYTGDSVRFGSAGLVTVADAAGLQGTEGCYVILSDYITQQNTDERFISKYDAGGTQVDFSVKDSTTLRVFNGATTSDITADIVGKRYVALNWGLVPEAFIDGNSAGTGSSIAITADDADVIVGNLYTGAKRFTSNIQAAVIVSRKLTATEHSRLYAELMAMQWANAPHIVEDDTFKTDYGTNVSTANITVGEIEKTGFTVDSGTFQVADDEIEGVPVKAIECIATGDIRITTGKLGQTNTEAAYGKWDFWYYTDSGNSSGRNINFIKDDSSSYYRLLFYPSTALSPSNADVLKFREGAFTALFDTVAGFLSDDQWARFTIRRDSLNEFSVYYNNVLIPVDTGSNPVTDATVIASEYMRLEMKTGDKLALSSANGKYSLNKDINP